jgi:release factor glutamine methyltransferase
VTWADNASLTVQELLSRAGRRLRVSGAATPELDAEMLLRHVLGWDRATLVAEGRSRLDADVSRRFESLIEERAKGRPIQHLTETQHFWRHEFRVTPDVLIPRPETELIVEAALELLRPIAKPIVVDVGTGSGCIALSLAAERPDAAVHAVDISPAALAVAEDNARRLGLEGRVTFHRGDLLAPVRGLEGSLDLVASNPPYVDPADPTLAPEVRDHEPAVALHPPAGAASFYQRLIAEAGNLLRPGGFLVMEVGQGIARDVSRLCEAGGFSVKSMLEDMAGIPRTVVALTGRTRRA